MGGAAEIIQVSYFLISILFIVALKGLQGNAYKTSIWYAVAGILISIPMTFFSDQFGWGDLLRFSIACVPAIVRNFAFQNQVDIYNQYYKIDTIQVPDWLSFFQGCYGISIIFISFSSFQRKTSGYSSNDVANLGSFETFFGVLFGCIIFSQSIIMLLKIRNKIPQQPFILIRGSSRTYYHLVMLIVIFTLLIIMITTDSVIVLIILVIVSLGWGTSTSLAFGFGETSIVLSWINSLIGFGLVSVGFQIDNYLLIITGSLIGSSGVIISQEQCKLLNKKLWRVILIGGKPLNLNLQNNAQGEGQIKYYNSDQAIQDLCKSKSIIIVPGYGVFEEKAQFTIAFLAKHLNQMGINCKFCLHPYVSRVSGQMNLVLMEAGVPFNQIFDLKDINNEFQSTDSVIVIDGDDLINPTASSNPKSHIYGIPPCEVWKAQRVIVIRREQPQPQENNMLLRDNFRIYLGAPQQNIIELQNTLNKRQQNQFKKNIYQDEEDKQKIDYDLEDQNQIQTYVRNAVLKINVPKETYGGEKRVAIVPKTVKKLLKLGFVVNIEEDAGLDAGYSNQEYEKNGALIVSYQTVWENSDIMVKVQPPSLNLQYNYHESQFLKNTSLLICNIYPQFNQETIEMLIQNRQLVVFSFDSIHGMRLQNKRYINLDYQEETEAIIGYKGMLEAFRQYQNFPFRTNSNISPAKILIFGSKGQTSLAAAKTASDLGADVTVFDFNDYYKDKFENINNLKFHFETSEKEQISFLQKECEDSDIIVLNKLNKNNLADTYIFKENIKKMTPGSVILDLVARQGGNCQITKKFEIYEESLNHVRIIGLTNFESQMARLSSEIYSECIFRLFEELIDINSNPQNTAKNFKINFEDELIRNLTIIKQGNYNIPLEEKDIDMFRNDKFEQRSSVDGSTKTSVDNNNMKTVTQDIQLDVQLLDKNDDDDFKQFSFFTEQAQKTEKIVENLKQNHQYFTIFMIVGVFIIAIIAGICTNLDFVNHFGVLVLSLILGYSFLAKTETMFQTVLIWELTALSGIVLIGGMYSMCLDEEEDYSGFFTIYTMLGFVGVIFSSLNIFASFRVAYKMLQAIEK